MARKKTPAPIIVVHRPHVEHDEEPHGAWKLAYADFVTAMMAFFLIMWLLNSTNTEQRKGIADYFNPVAVSQSTSGTDGMLAGRSVDSSGALTTPNAAADEASPVASPPVVASVGADDRQPAGRQDAMPHPLGGTVQVDTIDLLKTMPTMPGDQPPQTGEPRSPQKEFEELLDRQAALANKQFALEELEHGIRRQLETSPELAQLSASVLIQQVPEGLRIQLTDQAKFSMFRVGSPQMNEQGRQLMRLVSAAIAKVPNGLSITGHTDALGYAPDARYGNWELSSDRANAARRELIQAGVPAHRIRRVEGRADLDHLEAVDPLDPRNRRISITILRQPATK